MTIEDQLKVYRTNNLLFIDKGFNYDDDAY